MARKDIEVLTAELLSKAQVQYPPVPIEEIAVSQGALLARHHFSGTESGFALRQDGRWIIGVNTATSQRRQRFSIAHELGHLLLHPGKPLIVDHSVLISKRDNLSSTGTDPEEIEANRFAANILMPHEMILHQLQQDMPIYKFDSRDELIAHMARAFDVSTEAMGYRLINLNIMSA